MSYKPLTIEKLRDMIHEGECTDPLVFLESVMGGRDPRKTSSIYELILEIDSFTNGNISKSDWNEILDHVHNNHKFHTVTLNESIAAGKTLAEYLHAKRKQVDVTTHDKSSSDSANVPLTEEEIKLFKEKFNDDF